jgi:hypothetical protein
VRSLHLCFIRIPATDRGLWVTECRATGTEESECPKMFLIPRYAMYVWHYIAARSRKHDYCGKVTRSFMISHII